MKIKTRRYYIYYLALVAGFFVAIIPLRVATFFATLAGRLAFVVAKRERETALKNLRMAFPEKSEEWREQIARNVFINLCKNGIEFLNTYKLNKRNIGLWVDEEGFENVDNSIKKGKGTLLVTCHLGNWELIPFCFAFRGYASTIIVRKLYFHKYDNIIHKVRRSRGIKVMYRDESPRRILKVLKNNESIGMLADQDMDSLEGVFVDFFGHPAYTIVAPIAIALATGAQLLPCFMFRENGKHKYVIEEPMEIEKFKDKKETYRVNMQKWSKRLEDYIRRYPDQWVWIHKRWKTKPAQAD